MPSFESMRIVLAAAWESRGLVRVLVDGVVQAVQAFVRVKRVYGGATAFYVNRLGKTVVCLFSGNRVYCTFAKGGDVVDRLADISADPQKYLLHDSSIEFVFRRPVEAQPLLFDFLAGVHYTSTRSERGRVEYGESIYLEEAQWTVVCVCDGNVAWIEAVPGSFPSASDLEGFVLDRTLNR